MTTARAAPDLSQSPPVNISCRWSSDYLTTGQSNKGELQLRLVSTGDPITLAQGEKIGFPTLPSGWSIAPSSTDWVAAKIAYRGGSVPAIQYVGASKAAAPVIRSVVHLFTDGLDLADSPPALGVPVSVTVPEGAAGEMSQPVQLFDASDAPLSTSTLVLFNMIAPDSPYVAFADAPGVVLITAPQAIRFDNTLGVTLLNLQATEGNALPVTLTLSALAADGTTVTIPASVLNEVTVSSTGATWSYSPQSTSWSATLGALPGGGQADIKLGSLALDVAGIALLSVDLTIDTGSGSPYPTRAWFQACGPYIVDVALSQTVSDQIWYTLVGPAGGPYAVNALNRGMMSPPLQPDLHDTNDNVVYPPVPGYFSWQPNIPDFPSNYRLSDGSNILYYIIKSGSAFMPLTTSTVNYNFQDGTVQAAGYQQAYGDPGTPQFGPIMPSGAIILWSGVVSAIPAGWLLCDGTNNTPNLQSSFVVGAGNSEPPGGSGPATSHTHTFALNNSFTTSWNGDHDHGMPSAWYNRNLSCGVHTGIDTNGGSVGDQKTQVSGGHNHTVGVSFNATTDQTTAPRPAWYALCYIMKQ